MLLVQLLVVLVGRLLGRVERRGIVSREAGHAELAAAARLEQRLGCEELQRVGADLLAHPLAILARRDELLVGRGVDSVEAGVGHQGGWRCARAPRWLPPP